MCTLGASLSLSYCGLSLSLSVSSVSVSVSPSLMISHPLVLYLSQSLSINFSAHSLNRSHSVSLFPLVRRFLRVATHNLGGSFLLDHVLDSVHLSDPGFFHLYDCHQSMRHRCGGLRSRVRSLSLASCSCSCSLCVCAFVFVSMCFPVLGLLFSLSCCLVSPQVLANNPSIYRFLSTHLFIHLCIYLPECHTHKRTHVLAQSHALSYTSLTDLFTHIHSLPVLLSHTFTLTHIFAHSLTHSLTFNQNLTRICARSLSLSLNHTFTRVLILPLCSL
jgi:hypothetical protein